jgi:hypothetical protein
VEDGPGVPVPHRLQRRDHRGPPPRRIPASSTPIATAARSSSSRGSRARVPSGTSERRWRC